MKPNLERRQTHIPDVNDSTPYIFPGPGSVWSEEKTG
jgi:hypothetical protein